MFPRKSLESCTPYEAARSAALWNTILALGQAAASLITGNVGFWVEMGHNGSDAVSFEAKARSMKSPERRKSLRLRRLAATILATGAAAGIGGGVYHAIENKNERASDGAIGMAFAGAVINALIARRTQSARHKQTSPLEGGTLANGAHEDSKLHALTDAGTGVLYTGGLVLERYMPGVANWFVVANGLITATSAGITAQRIRRTAA